MRILQEIEARFQGVKKSGPRGWYGIPNCPACGRPKKFYFNEEGRFCCFSVHCGVHGSLKDLGPLLRKHGYDVSFDFKNSTLEEIKEFYDKAGSPHRSQGALSGGASGQFYGVVLPSGFKQFDTEHLPAYFVDERRYHSILPLEFGMGWCQDAKYSRRIIIPLETLANRAWLAYATHRTPRTIKALYPPGCPISRFMWPYNWVRGQIGRHRVILVEGVTDALRIFCHRIDGYEDAYPLALLGKNVSSYHIDALADLLKTGTHEITVCLDGDALKVLRSTVKKLTGIFGKDKISFIDWSRIDGLPGPAQSIDPDNIRDGKLWEKISTSRRQAAISLL